MLTAIAYRVSWNEATVAAACAEVARCYCGEYQCPECGTHYDPTFGRACPRCGAGGNDYRDALPDYQREDWVGE